MNAWVTALAAMGATPVAGVAAFQVMERDEPDVVIVEQDMRARRNAQLEPKIFDGTPVPAGAYLSTVAITRPRSRLPSCTGSLLLPNIVLTAAHCVCGGVTGSVYVGTDPKVSSGPKSGRYYPIRRWRSAMNCEASLKPGRDIALVLLGTPVAGAALAEIGNKDLIQRATSYRVVGFGAIDKDGKVFTDEKREAAVAAVSNDCLGTKDGLPNEQSDEKYYGCLPGEEIVAGQRRSPDTCDGDSGGPLLVTAGGTSGRGSGDRYYLAGVTSRPVAKSPDACGHGGIYERLTPAARQWIVDNIRKIRAG